MARNFWDEAEQAASLQGNPGAFERGASRVGRGLLDFGQNAIEGLAANWSPTYAHRVQLQQQLEADQKRSGMNSQYMDQLLGQKANNPQNIDIGSYDNITQELMGEEGIQQGTGYFGSAQSPLDQLKLMAGMTSAPSKITQTAGAGMMRDLMAAQNKPEGAFKPNYTTVGVQGQPKMRQQAYMDQQGQLQNFGDPYGTSGGVTVNTGQKYPEGRPLTKEEKTEQGLDANSGYWDKGDGSSPKKYGGYSDTQMKSAGFAQAMVKTNAIINKLESSGYMGSLMDNLEQLGAGEALAAMKRSAEGRAYNQAAGEWLSTYLVDVSGATVTEEEFERKRSIYFWTPGDTKADSAQKATARRRAERTAIQKSGGAWGKKFHEDEPPVAKPEADPAKPNKGKIIKWEDLK